MHQSHGQILWIVFGLEEGYTEQSVEDRRRLAGEKFRDGMKPVKPSTIRQHHEKKALDRLTEMLLDYNRRNAESTSTRPRALR